MTSARAVSHTERPIVQDHMTRGCGTPAIVVRHTRWTDPMTLAEAVAEAMADAIVEPEKHFLDLSNDRREEEQLKQFKLKSKPSPRLAFLNTAESCAAMLENAIRRCVCVTHGEQKPMRNGKRVGQQEMDPDDVGNMLKEGPLSNHHESELEAIATERATARASVRASARAERRLAIARAKLLTQAKSVEWQAQEARARADERRAAARARDLEEEELIKSRARAWDRSLQPSDEPDPSPSHRMSARDLARLQIARAQSEAMKSERDNRSHGLSWPNDNLYRGERDSQKKGQSSISNRFHSYGSKGHQYLGPISERANGVLMTSPSYHQLCSHSPPGIPRNLLELSGRRSLRASQHDELQELYA